MPKTKLNLGKRAFSVAASNVWSELPITLKTSETLAVFRKKTQDIFIPNCISTINMRLSLVLIMTFARPCSRLCLMILFCCASELRFLRISSSYKLSIIIIMEVLIGLLLNFCSYRHIWRINVSESAPTTQQVGPAFVSLINGLAGYSSKQNIHGEMLRNWSSSIHNSSQPYIH